MSDNPKKTFLSTLGKHIVVGSELMPAVEPKPPVDDAAAAAKKKEEEAAAIEAKKVADAKAAEDAAAKKAEEDKKAADAAKAAAKPAPEPAVKIAAKKSDPLPPIKPEDMSTAPVAADEPKKVEALLDYPASRAEVRYLEVLQAGAQRDPDKYTPIFDREVDRLKKVNAFATKWKDEHPDEELTKDDPEYRKFLRANPPAIDSTEHEDLKDELREERAKDRAKAEMRQDLDVQARKVVELEIKPAIQQAVEEVDSAVLAALPDAIEEDDYLHDVAKEGIKALEKVPLEGKIFATALSRGRVLVGEFIKLRKGATKFDVQNPAHVFISRTIATAAEIFEAKGGAERIRDGRRFVQPKVFGQLKPEAQAKHWTFSDDEIISTIASMTAKGAIEELTERRADEKAAAEFKKAKVPNGKQAAKAPAAVPVSSPAVSPSPASPGSGASTVKNARLKSMLGITSNAA